MSATPQFQPPPPPPGLTVREARPDDNDALITLELESPLRLGRRSVTFDRSPDFFRRHRLQPEGYLVVAEMEGRLVGVTAAAIHDVGIQGSSQRLAYIHHGRVHPSVRRLGVASALVMALVTWARERGAEGPYWLISPANRVSLAFSRRAGGRWPVDVGFVDIDVSRAEAPGARAVAPERLAEAVALVNSTHEGEELFQPYTTETLSQRLARDGQYGPGNLRGVVEDGRLVAVAGYWDWSSSVETVTVDRPGDGAVRTSTAAALDWGYAPDRRDAFARLLLSLAAEARAAGRSALTLCEPSAGALPDVGPLVRRWRLSLVTPTVTPPCREAVRGLFADLVYV